MRFGTELGGATASHFKDGMHTVSTHTIADKDEADAGMRLVAIVDIGRVWHTPDGGAQQIVD